MNASALRVGAIARRVLHGLRHDKRSLALVAIAPIFAMFVFGLVFGSEIGHLAVVVVDDADNPFTASVIANLAEGDRLDVEIVDGYAAAFARVRDGDAWAVIRFPAGYPQAGNVSVSADGSNAQATSIIFQRLAASLQTAANDARPGAGAGTIDTTYVYAAQARYMDFFVPGIMGFAAFLFTTLLTLLAFVSERTQGTLGRLLTTPVLGWEIVAGYAVAFALLGIVQATLLLVVGLLAFDILVTGSLALAFVLIALLAVDSLSLGILLSAAARRESQAVQFIPLIVLPVFLLSGVFLPLEALPTWLRPLAYAMPPTYAVDGLRDVMLRGWALDRVWIDVVALASFALVFLALAAWRIERLRARAAK